MRALFASYESQLKAGNYIFVAKTTIHEKNFLELKKDFNFALKKLDVLK
jgi:RNase P protein component